MKQRSLHKLSKTALATFDPGEFVPIGLTEVLPGDGIQAKTDAVIRALPLLAPVMHEVEVIITHAYTPHRIIWDDWESFITGGDDGLDASVLPTIDFSGAPVAKGDLANYLGLPVGFNGSASALPFRAYAAFWNTHIRDEELQTALVIDTTSGADTTTSTTLKNVNWSGDRFTRANANEQLGSAVTIPLGTRAELKYDTFSGTDITDKFFVAEHSPGGAAYFSYGNTLAVDTSDIPASSKHNVYTDLSGADAATINQWREALALQKFAEMRQIYGSTIEKMTRADFGVNIQDYRLQNPEILAKGRGMINFSEVLATAETGTSVDVGDMKGHGIAAMRTNKFRSFFPEFGYLMSFVAIRPKATYSQGVDRHWLKTTKEEFYSPHLEHMGMQAIQNREVKYNHSSPTGTFAYEPRYNEYRSQHNTYHGDFADSSLNYWHMGRDLSGDPALNSAFITCSPTNRVFAQSVTNNMLGMFRHHIAARRLVKKSVRPVGLI